MFTKFGVKQHSRWRPLNSCKGITFVPDECYDDVIKWKHFPRNWPFVRGIHRSPGNSPHKGQWRGGTGEFPTQMASYAELWCFLWSASEFGAGYSRRDRAHYDVIAMVICLKIWWVAFNTLMKQRTLFLKRLNSTSQTGELQRLKVPPVLNH